MLCTRCGKRPAVVFVSNNNSKDAPTAGYCLTCAKELGIKPVEDLISKMGISDEDLENVQDQMNTLMNSMGDGDMSQLMEQLGADNLAEQMGDFLRRPYLFPCAGKDRGEKGARLRLGASCL